MKNNRAPFIVGIGGTTREGSSSEQALEIALAHASRRGIETLTFGGSDLLSLPLYDPSYSAERPVPQAERLIAALRRADGVVLSSPCYHGGISGLIKNAIDYTEQMRADERVYLDGRAVGSVGCG
jgi:FMN reductase